MIVSKLPPQPQYVPVRTESGAWQKFALQSLPMTEHTPNHWHILGAGAIGSLWACYAYRQGSPATLILRDQTRLQAYRQGGGITARLGPIAMELPVPVTSPESLPGPVAQLLVTTKAHQTLAALDAIAPALTEAPLLVLLQNGLGVAEQVAARFPQARILQASTTEGAYREGPFSLVHAGRGQTLVGQSENLLLTQKRPALEGEELQRVAGGLSFPPLKMNVSDNIDRVLWVKLAVNCVINPLTVKYRCRNGELLDNPQSLVEINELVEEIVGLSQQLGRGEWVEDLLPRVRKVAANTAMNRSSMLQDVEAGRATEIPYITGYLCQLAEARGIELPRNRHLLELVENVSASA